jgi:hypothetical protein
LAGDENTLPEIAVRHFAQVERFERLRDPRWCRSITARHAATLLRVHRRVRWPTHLSVAIPVIE